MMWRPKILFLTSLLTGIGAVALINEIAISRYRPVATLADGRQVAFNPDDIRGCMGARALASIGDEMSHWQWQHCETVLAQVHALEGFALRYWSLLMASAFALVSAFGFALAIGFESRAPRVLRGRRLLTGEAARRAFLRTTKAESALSGEGLE
jgi:hypothetical protein